MVQRCCCCIQLRTGVFLISFLVLVQSLAGAYVAFSYVDVATKFTKSLGYVHGVWNIIRGVIALGGLIGAIMQNKKLVKYFALIISASALFYLVFGLSISIISIKNKDTLVEMCIEKFNEEAHEGTYWSPVVHWTKPYGKRQQEEPEEANSTDTANSTDNANFTNHTDNAIPQNTQSERELCQQGVKLYLGFAITYTIIGFLLMFYFASVIGDYGEDLRRNDMMKVLQDDTSVSPKPARGIMTL